MRTRYAFILASIGFASTAMAQSYCSPTFANGCFSWRNLTIYLNTISWDIGATDCGTSDYTAMSTTVYAGQPADMTVISGNWCGCAVWVDLDNSSSFEDSENLYYSYVGGDPSYTYDFPITIPANTPSGSYRMRVIAPWGSDGFLSTNTNGFGACGSFQYGNFDDFTLNVIGSTGIADHATNAPLSLGPNPTSGDVTLSVGNDFPLDHIVITSVDGRVVIDRAFNGLAGAVRMDLKTLPSGAYTVQGISANGRYATRLVKE